MKTAPRSSAKRPRTLAGTAPASTDAARTRALAHYEAALRLMQESKFEKACDAFRQLLASSPADLAERIRMYINACTQQASRHESRFHSGEERYDYAISLLNDGNYEDARTQLKKILSDNSSADYALYGLAVLASMTGDAHALPRTPHRGHPSQSAQPHPGTRRLRLPGHGRRPALHRTPLPRGLTARRKYARAPHSIYTGIQQCPPQLKTASRPSE